MDIGIDLQLAYDDGYKQGLADAVGHAHWQWFEFEGDNWKTLCCSNCYDTRGARESANYCSACGFKMDEVIV